MAAVKEASTDLLRKFKDGEIELDEYSEQLETLNAQRDALAEVRFKAAVAEDMNTQTTAQRWQFAVERFADAVRSENIDYRTDQEKQADLDSFVKTLAANPKNADKDFDWFLQEAHKRVKALHGILDTAVGVPDKTPAASSRKPPIDSAPKTLAQVPGSDGVGDIGGEFANLDALDGMAYEAAIAKMTPEQRDRFVRGL